MDGVIMLVRTLCYVVLFCTWKNEMFGDYYCSCRHCVDGRKEACSGAEENDA